MAGNCFRRFWWWLPIAILSGCFPPAAGRISCTSAYPSETARDVRPRSDADVVIFLGERCDGEEINVTEIQDHLERAPDLAGELSISVMPRSREYATRVGLYPTILLIQEREARRRDARVTANFNTATPISGKLEYFIWITDVRHARLENTVRACKQSKIHKAAGGI